MTRTVLLATAVCAVALGGACAWAEGGSGGVHGQVPKPVDPKGKYLFHMHGVWLERHGLNDPHPRHGRYRHADIARVLSKRGFVVIAEHRKTEVDPRQYGRKVAHEVQGLLAAGVPARHISVIGHSKGGLVTLAVASLLENPEVNFVSMAGCGKRGTSFRRGYEKFLSQRASLMQGRVLSLYDASDTTSGTCREAFAKANKAKLESKEIVLNTRRGHGIFYTPNPIWINEVVKWIGATPAREKGR